MSKPDKMAEPPVVKETLKTLALLLDAVIKDIQEPTQHYMNWFIAKLNTIIPQCANKQTSQKLGSDSRRG
jgi:hypothetical protein